MARIPVAKRELWQSTSGSIIATAFATVNKVNQRGLVRAYQKQSLTDSSAKEMYGEGKATMPTERLTVTARGIGWLDSHALSLMPVR